MGLNEGSDNAEKAVGVLDRDSDGLTIGVVEGKYKGFDEVIGNDLSDCFHVDLNKGNHTVGDVEEDDDGSIRLGVVVIIFIGFCDIVIVGLELGILLEVGLVA